MRWPFLLALAVWMAPLNASGQSRDVLADAARAFDESALRSQDNNAKPLSIRKWKGPITLTFANPSMAPSLVEITRQAVKGEAQEAGLSVIDLADGDKAANYAVLFDENGLNGQAGWCWGSSWWKSWEINRAVLRMNPSRNRDADRCAWHEALHTLGFGSHPHAAFSVLSYTQKAQRTLTPLDLHLIHTLYDPRVTPGLAPAPASQLACRILGEKLKSPAADIEAVCTGRKGPTP